MQFCHIRLRSEIFWFPTRGYCICKTGRLKKRRDYLDIRIIRLLSLSLSLSLSGLRASIYERLFNYQRVSRNFRSGKSCLFTRQPYDRYHYVFAACFRQRWEYRALSGGMRYMDLPCPYAAEMIYTPHRTAAKPWQRPDKRVSAWGSQAAFYLSSRTISLSQMTKGNSFTLAWREIALLRIKHKVAI